MQRVISPVNGEIIAEYQEHDSSAQQAAVVRAQAAFLAWRTCPLPQRAARLRALADLLRTRQAALARLISREMGKVLKESLAEVEKCAAACDYFAEHGAAFLADRPVEAGFGKSYVTFQPLGVVLAVMPWNFPFWQVLRAAIPALTAGNAVLLKHASNTPGCALALEGLLREAGFPEGLFSALLMPGQEVAALIAHPHIRAVTLTGSTPAGRSVAQAAGAALKKTVLELGGSDAYIILEDADLPLAARLCAAGRLLNVGQSCIAVKRIIAVEAVYESFSQLLREEFARAVCGDPLDATTTLGPLARTDLRDSVHAQVRQCVEKGAKLLIGGTVPPGAGAFYPPTILTGVTPGMPAYGEEIFGPVSALIAAKDEADALRIANDSPFGLGGGVFTRDAARGERIAREGLESGSAWVNACVRSDARLPFGGVKDSGYGRELSAFGIHEFVNIKSVVVA